MVSGCGPILGAAQLDVSLQEKEGEPGVPDGHAGDGHPQAQGRTGADGNGEYGGGGGY